MSKRTTSFFEFWPGWLFYGPLVLYYIWLSARYWSFTLPSIANPLFDNGGYIGESKLQILDQIPRHMMLMVAEYTSIMRSGADHESALQDVETARAALRGANMTYPQVSKPDLGCRGMGVCILRNDDDLLQYLLDYPANQRIIFQALYDYPYEAGLFYIRYPSETRGRIFSFTDKQFAHVRGDGVSTLKQLIERDPRAGKIAHIYLPRHRERWSNVIPDGQRFRIAFAGSHSRGTVFKNGHHLITPELEQCWQDVVDEIPEFYFGRLDIRYQHPDDLYHPQRCKIIEVNGAGAEATHIWDADTSLWDANKTLFAQFGHAYAIGHQNRKRGFTPMSVPNILKTIVHHKKLSAHYPETH